MGETAVNSLREAETIAQSQYEMYVDERLKQRSILISNIIPKKQCLPVQENSTNLTLQNSP